MALVLADRVYETSTTVGTGTLTLNGALASYQTFSTAIGNGNTCYYTIAASGGTAWEVGIGTVGAGTLARTTILSSSNANAAVVLPAGTVNVFVTYPAEKSIHLDASGEANIGVSVLSDVTLATPLVNQVLGYNGTAWTNVEGNSASAGPGVVFYNATPSITAVSANNVVPVLTLATIPVTTAEQTLSGTAVSNTVLFSSFISAALGRTLIDAGVWSFTTWIGVDSVAGGSSTYLTRQVYTAIPFIASTVTTTGTGTSRTATASSGTPFATGVIDASATNTVASYLQTTQGLYQITARTSDTVVTIATPNAYANETASVGIVLKKLFGVTTAPAVTAISPAYQQFDLIVTAGQYTVTALTGIAILGFVTSDATRTITIPYNGTDRNTHVNSPLANLHNDLNGLQGGSGAERYHSTSAEYTGTGTGVFVRQSNASLISPALGTPTSGNLSSCTSTSMVLTTPVLGTPTSGTLTNCSGTATALNIGGNAATATTAAACSGNAASATTAAACSGNSVTATTAAAVSNANSSQSGDGWWRSTGATGWYSTTYAVGIYATETGNLRPYNGAQFLPSTGTTTTVPILLTAGTNLTTPVAGAMEFDATNRYFTNTTATGRGYVPSVQYYTMVANNALVSVLTITPFFQTASTAIPLAANGIYDIEIVCYFTRSVAGTHLYTLTNSAAPTSMNVDVNFSPIAGNTTTPTGANLTGAIPTTALAAAAFVATGSLAITTVHVHKFYIHLENGAAASNLRLNVTSPTAGFTPLRGSYWRSTRVSNAGTYAA